MRAPAGLAILLVCACLFHSPAGRAAAAAPGPKAAPAEADNSVIAGKKALTHTTRFPWYDAESDSLRPVNVRPPEPDPITMTSNSFFGIFRLL